MRAASIGLAAILAAFPASALAQTAPYKLVIMLSSGTTITDYPSLARCERGRNAVLAELERSSQDFLRSAPRGTTVTPLPGSRSVFCIPG